VGGYAKGVGGDMRGVGVDGNEVWDRMGVRDRMG